MSTLTIELPEDIAEQIQRIPEPERNNFAIAALRKELSPSPTPARTADAILAYLKPVAPAPLPPDKTPRSHDATLELFAKWAEEDAKMTPEEQAENDRIYAEIEKNGIPRVQLQVALMPQTRVLDSFPLSGVGKNADNKRDATGFSG